MNNVPSIEEVAKVREDQLADLAERLFNKVVETLKGGNLLAITGYHECYAQALPLVNAKLEDWLVEYTAGNFVIKPKAATIEGVNGWQVLRQCPYGYKSYWKRVLKNKDSRPDYLNDTICYTLEPSLNGHYTLQKAEYAAGGSCRDLETLMNSVPDIEA